MAKKDFTEGESVNYTGRCFIGFEKTDLNMIYIGPYHELTSDVWVLYKGGKMLVSKYEIEKSKKK